MFKKLFVLSIFLLILCISIGIYGYIHFTDIIKKSESEKTIFTTELQSVNFSNANSRDTYFSIHKVSEAQKAGKGKNIKVGILDHSFAMYKHKDLYKGGQDFTGRTELLDEVESHGYWMASVLREIAPECDIYALCTWSASEDTKVNNMIKAINWAVDNDIDILTYSADEFSESNRKKMDEAVNHAVSKGLVTTFIHYDNENNIYPTGMFPFENSLGNRKPDLNIFHYDYNTLFVRQYLNIVNNGIVPRSGDDIPYFSVSSTSPVTAGFVAILKSVNNTLTPKEYKDILVKTSYSMDFYDWNFNQTFHCKRVVDIAKAVDYLRSTYGYKD
jgi:hypothetical protein